MIDPNRVSIGLGVGTSPSLKRVHLLVRAARVLGFDAAWTVDHFQSFYPRSLWDRRFSWMAKADGSPHPYFDYQSLVGHLASRVGPMHIGVGVTEPIRRHPVLLAQAAMTWSHMTKRSPILGLGAGERENLDPYGFDFSRPVSRLEEALEIIRLCFDSDGPIDYSGEFFTLDGAVMDLKPAPGNRPLLWIAAHGPRMLRLTGRYGDGWYPTLPMTPQEYGDALATVRAEAAQAGRNPDQIVPAWQVFSVIGRTRAHARRLLDSRFVRFMALLAPETAWRQRGLDHPLGEGFRGMIDFVPERWERTELEAAIARVPTDLVADAVVWGTPDDVLRRLGEHVDAGLRHIVLAPASAAVSRRDALYSLRQMVRILHKLRAAGVPNPVGAGL